MAGSSSVVDLDSLKIREINRDDSPGIMKLIKELAKATTSGQETRLKIRDIEIDGIDHDPPFFQGIAALDKKTEVIGVALYHLKYSTWEGQVMHLNTFAVTEKYRRVGVGSKLLQKLGKIAMDKKYTRISLEVSNEPGLNFFLKNGAINLTKEEDWLNYSFSPEMVKKLTEVSKRVENVQIRVAEPKDCVQLRELIQELAEFEKMPDGPKLSVKELQRDGFYKLHPAFYAFVAELNDEESDEKEIIGFSIHFLTYHPLKGRMIHLEDLYVTPKHRNKGIGEMLFKNVAKQVHEGKYQGFTLEVLGWNSKAIQFYDKFNGTNDSAGNGKQSLRFRPESIKSLATGKKTADSEQIIIRPAERPDCEIVASLIKDLAEYEKMKEKAVLTGKRIETDAFDSNPPLVHILIAEQTGTKAVIGYALYYFTYSTWKGKAIHMEDIYVKPEHRFRRVGEKILKYLAMIADEQNYARISFECIDWNEPAIKFYKKHGAEDVTTTEHWDSYRFENPVMHKLASE